MPSRRAVMTGLAAVPVAALPTVGEAARTARHGFNDAEIDWYLFDDGLAEAARTGKPILLLAHTTWCPHCRRTKPLYRDRSVVWRVNRFVPVLLDRDEQPELNERYAPDGGYVPRTMALMPDGTHIAEATGPYSDYRYLIPYEDATALRSFLALSYRLFETQAAGRS